MGRVLEGLGGPGGGPGPVHDGGGGPGPASDAPPSADVGARDRGRIRDKACTGASCRRGRRRSGGRRRRAAFTFRDLPRGSATLDRRVRDAPRARSPSPPTAWSLGGSQPGVASAASFPLAATGRRTRESSCGTEPFRAGDGRLLGALLSASRSLPRRDAWPAPARCSRWPSPRSSPRRPRVWPGLARGCGRRRRPRHRSRSRRRRSGRRAWSHSPYARSPVRIARAPARLVAASLSRAPSTRRDAAARRRGARRADRGLARPGGRGHVAADGRERRRLPRQQARRAWPRGDLFPTSVTQHARAVPLPLRRLVLRRCSRRSLRAGSTR